MLRSAAKNHEFVLPVVEPSDYAEVLELLRAGEVPGRDAGAPTRPRSSRTPPTTTAPSRAYLTPDGGGPAGPAERARWSGWQSLRYGENPQQRAALYVTEEPRGIRDLKQRQGKELSFNNLLDLDAAMAAVAPLDQPARLRHHQAHHALRPRRRRASAAEAFARALATDPRVGLRRRGGVQHRGGPRPTAEAMADLFLEVIVAPSFHDEALQVLAAKKNLRVVELPVSHGERRARLQARARRLPGPGPASSSIPSEDGLARRRRSAHPTEAEWSDLRFALGRRGVGQVERHPAGARRGGHRHRRRPDEPGGQRRSSRCTRRGSRGTTRAGRVLASDGFFPFPDGVGGGRGRRRHRHHPAGRLGAGRGRDRGGRPARPRHGPHRHAAVQALTETSLTTHQDLPTPYRWAALVGLGASSGSTSPRSRPPPRSGTPPSTSPPRRCSASPTRRATRSSSSWRTSGGCCRSPASTPSAINLFAAFTSAAVGGALVPDRRALAPHHRPGPVGAASLAAFAGTLVCATSWTVWNQSTVNEKVYTVSLLSMALVTWLAVHWGDDEPGPAPRPLAHPHRLHHRARRPPTT